MNIFYKIIIFFSKNFYFRILIYNSLYEKVCLILFWMRLFQKKLKLISKFQKSKKTNLNIIQSVCFWNGSFGTELFQKVLVFQKTNFFGSLIVSVNKNLFRNLRIYFKNSRCGNSYRNLTTKKRFKFANSDLRDIICGNYCILLKTFWRFINDFFGVLRMTSKWILIIFSLLVISNVIMSQEPSSEKEETKKKEIIVTGKADFTNPNSASEDTIRSEQIRSRPLSRTGEIAEFVPGMIATQHSGSGKGNQYFLRGFNLDHGTDFASHVNGIPINNPSHGHGQGYTDLSF
ncbi:TonB-dependent receptor plug domain protein [Leptospira interrogans serovar Bataviae str. HAI135]|nr:TonB-dependent receptor plug domain protein [Leptospira interrogans serovar Bataviae str. HAI135]